MTNTTNMFSPGCKFRNLLVQVSVIAGLFLLVGCASSPQPPIYALQAAELAISNAEKERVVDYASSELNEARNKLAAANIAVDQKKMILALQLAEESRVNAELASAKAEVSKGKQINNQMQKNIDTLKQEMQRNSGVR